MANSFICNQCKGDEVKEFPSMRELQTHIKDVHILKKRQEIAAMPVPPKPEVPAAPAPAKTVNIVQPKKIVLTYQFTGECPTCLIPIETMDLEVDDNLYMVAFCPNCKKKHESKRVIPIESMSGWTKKK